MARGTEKPISSSVKTLRISNLLRCIDEGRFAIPKLQREFVWDGRKAAMLFDSIAKGMPIGVVMVWETPRSQQLYLRQKYHVLPQFNPANSKVWFLIDGQQRISVIHHVREGSALNNAQRKQIDFQRVVFCVGKDEPGRSIQYRNPKPGLYEPLASILHPKWRHRLSHLGAQALRRVEKCRKSILNYPIRMMHIQAELETIRETFLRINTQGMKIGTAGAIFTQAEELELRDIQYDIRSHVDDNFGVIPEMPILFAVGAIHGAAEARGEALKKTISELNDKAKHDPKLRRALARDWHRLSTCFGKAVDYLRLNFSVVSRDYIYSDYMIAMLALFYFWNAKGPNGPQREEIRKWFWATSVGSRYSGSKFNTCIPEDVRFFQKLAKGGNAKFSYSPQVDRIDVRKALYSARTGITSAFYCLLMLRKPVSILDEGLNEIPVDRYATIANRKDRHHIFPRNLMAHAKVPASLYNSICNICLLTAQENQSINNRRPRSYLGEIKRNAKYFNCKMDRHLIPSRPENGIWDPDLKKGFNKLLKERREWICRELEEAAGISLFRKET